VWVKGNDTDVAVKQTVAKTFAPILAFLGWLRGMREYKLISDT